METTVRRSERVVENLNSGLHAVFAADSQVYLIGEDIHDPYGGAFKVSRGLSTAYPGRVLTTPISEECIVGLAGGLALCGDRPIVEIMFGDFIALGFDQILNFASKSVTMYGHRLDFNLVVRCPVGGNRGYGPTHSQSLQKHFIGIPDLALYELSPFHDNRLVLHKLLQLGTPSILFEDKVLYTQRMYENGQIDELFSYEFLDEEYNFVRVHAPVFESPQCAIIAAGGVFHRCLAAAQKLLIELEVETEIYVPSRLYPFDPAALLPFLKKVQHVFVVEEGVAGGTWGAEVAKTLHASLWNSLKSPVGCIHSRNGILPSSAHLERQVIVQTEDIYKAIEEALADV